MKAGMFYRGILQKKVVLFSEHGKLSLEINGSNLLWFSSSTAKTRNFKSVTKTVFSFIQFVAL